MAKKHAFFNRFQLRVLAIWILLIAGIFSLWSGYSPYRGQLQKWTTRQVLQASQEGKILQGVIQSDPTRGAEWYRLRGQAKLDKPVVTEGGETKDSVLFEAQGRLTSDRFNALLNSSVNWRERPSHTLWTDILLSVLPVLVIFGFFYFIFVRQLRNAGRNAMGFARSRARMLTPNNKKKTLQDVAGCDEAKEEVAEIIDFLRTPKKFQDIGGRIPKGCLMVGPPGTGKTLLARAIAGEADVPFFSISGSDFVEMFVGVGAARVRDMFEQARKNAPCILFIDEIDAVGRHRGAGLGGGNDEREQTLNSLLVEMDGFDSREGVIIIAATNRPDVLDNALLRPGRFDRQVVIDLPDLHGRCDILKVHSQKIKMKPEVILEDIARTTSGFSGADLENLLNESALLAARYNKTEVERSDVEEAREKIAYGRERKKLMDDKDKKVTAYHEAGHAIVQAVVDDGDLPVHKVTIIPRGQSLGSTMFLPKKDILNVSKQGALARICSSMGGRVAEELVFGEAAMTSGASMDIKTATKMARSMVCDWGMSPLGTVAYGDNRDHIFLGREISREQNYSEETAKKIDAEILKIVSGEKERARRILSERRDSLEKLAVALLQHETIEGRSVYELVQTGDFQTEIEVHRSVPATPSAEGEPKSEASAAQEPPAPGQTENEGPKPGSELSEKTEEKGPEEAD
ncbi:MAG: ATP-dependent zinc metalloprotease FtsH [Puniceicoccales bacterium]|jgi:cell division protease FtsH|nr:ATP-dependent zinc metalloprotease FtsH [Puniceicoccales bacterium]